MPALPRNDNGAATEMEHEMARGKQRDHTPGLKVQAVTAAPKGDQHFSRSEGHAALQPLSYP